MALIDLYGNKVWKDWEITLRTEEIVHSACSLSNEIILIRKILGSQTQRWVLSESELEELELYLQACMNAYQVGVQARQDNQLLLDILTAEPSYQLLQQNPIEPIEEEGVIINQEAIDQNIIARNNAQNIIDNIPETVLEWLQKRNPSIESE